MPRIDTRPETTTSRAWWRSPSAWGGLLAVGGGLLHTATAALMRREVWAQIVHEGFLNTVALDPPPDRLAVAEAFWFSPGSFGVPLLLLGSLVTWQTRRGDRVPGWLGWGISGWAVLLGLLGGFDTGTFTLLLIGALLVVGAREARRGPGRRTARSRSSTTGSILDASGAAHPSTPGPTPGTSASDPGRTAEVRPGSDAESGAALRSSRP